MASLLDIRRNIQGISKIKKITEALKMVSAAMIYRAEQRLNKTRPYSNMLYELIADMSAGIEMGSHQFFQLHESHNALIVIITSDRGLCGSFNGNVIREVNRYINAGKYRNFSLICIGKIGLTYFQRRKYAIEGQYINFIEGFQYSDVAEIVEMIIAYYLEKKYSRINIVYNEFKSASVQTVTNIQLLPMTIFENNKRVESIEYIYEPSSETVIDSLLKQHITFQVYRFVVESFAAEQAARMAAMQSATDNAQEVLNNLGLTLNRLRQAMITTEIAEIVGAAEVLS
ncbi:MAG: ATP synthase F1 subunit gamma [Candidatus Margulisiibacteriota bacterium]|nr:MAG: ATP synthase F1 subunit gamma [Candidatus Margulisbacteria bacterium GWD2_39_127]OGI02775.1 MAG: ATP synthase F1 subunit gamma [Candidatus Margulisbacteria bacterium GWF2_38_17]OGI09338.1 MAG: ATP synthase F1 subunit gamma [Candidatus Margulisbacteria bacterium GWE2_39_32]PZM77448.1 MAG: ATP synthase F1 subunit gamma [Candidatus Margulisiibacteriota bacterium]HAR63989.1 ATP synthase F1 subunit gamma [Candidatus Margulisiibacteriota bacterium]